MLQLLCCLLLGLGSLKGAPSSSATPMDTGESSASASTAADVKMEASSGRRRKPKSPEPSETGVEPSAAKRHKPDSSSASASESGAKHGADQDVIMGLESDTKAQAEMVQLTTDDGKSIAIPLELARNPQIFGVIATTLEHDPANRNVPVHNVSFGTLKAMLPLIMQLPQVLDHTKSLVGPARDFAVIKQLNVGNIPDLPAAMYVANYLDSPFILNALIWHFAQTVHQRVAHAQPPEQQKKLMEDATILNLPEEIKEILARYYFLQYQESIDKLLGLTRKTPISFDDFVAFEVIPEIFIKQLPNLNTQTLNTVMPTQNPINPGPFSPLEYASTVGSSATIHALLYLGADPNIASEPGSVLIKAIEINHIKIAKLLIEHGADPNVAHRRGTPLIRAVSVGLFDMVKLLVEHGADVNLGWGEATPLSATVFARGNTDTKIAILQYLISKGAHDPALMSHVFNSHLDEVSLSHDRRTWFETEVSPFMQAIVQAGTLISEDNLKYAKQFKDGPLKFTYPYLKKAYEQQQAEAQKKQAAAQSAAAEK